MIGASPRRTEDRRLLVGGGRFVDDLTREGMLHLGVVRSVEAHARITKLVLDEARALPGVVAAWSAAELPETARPMPSAYGAVRKGRPWSQPILAKDRVRYVGEPVAVVVAESPYRVADALELARVGYEPLPALATVEASLASPTRVHDGWPDNTALGVSGAIGDAELALATADVVIHETFRHPRLAAVPIETRGVLAYRDADSGALVVWSSCQNPYSVRDIVAAALELPAEAVRVLVPDVGGAFGPKGTVYPEEVLVAAAARRLGLDPAQIRRRNLVRPDEMPYRPGLTYKDGVPISYDPGDFPRAFERALGLLGYDDWRRRQTAQAGTARRIGVGLACYAQGTGLGPYEGATVRVDPSGKVYVLIGVAAQGQGHATTLAQIAATELGAAFEDVIVSAGDTALFPFGMGTGGSRVIANAGPAVARTARAVRERAARVAAELLECAPEDVRIERSRAFVVGVPARSVGLGRLAHAAVKSKALRTLGEPGLNACTYFHPETVTWAFGTHAAVVEVDVETCAVRLLAYAIVHDPGRAINPTIVEGQLQGGAAQSIGAGLMEAVVHDEHGQLLTASLMDYAIPKADQLPPLPVALEAHPSVINPLGVKGVGESGAIPGAAAIANAVEDAVADLGVVVREVPVTSARLFAALQAVAAGGKIPP